MTLKSDALEVALDAMSRSAIFIRRVREDLGQDDVHVKNDDSPVTIADLASQALTRLHLEEEVLVPAFPMCGEEGSDILREPGSDHFRGRVLELVQSEAPSIGEAELLALLDRGSHRPAVGARETFWVCDPIDGTKRYLSGHRYSTCLGLVIEGELACGSIACPDLGGRPEDRVEVADPEGSLFGAVEGGGAFRIEDLPAGSTGRRFCLERQPRADGDQRVRVARSVTSTGLRPGHFWERLSGNGALLEPVSIDNQCKYVALATDRVDCVYQHAGAADHQPGCIWDYAPGVLLASEAGSSVMDREGRPFDFNQGPTLIRNRGLAATSPGTRGFFPTLA